MIDPAHTPPISRRSRWSQYLGVLAAGLALLLATAIPASAAEIMRVTFIRHGESVGNASGLMDGSIPGPVLTDLGSQQARAVAEKLGDNNYDAIYASTMVRTQLTAAPMSQYLGLPINVVYGLRELDTGKFEGTPEANAPALMAYPMAWVFQGNLDAAIPDVDGNPVLDGHMFQDRVNGALQTMYDNGDRNVAAFSHGGTIMFWTLMNASNLTVQQKMDLLRNSSLKNTDYVVVEGNNEDGWVLVDWNGQKFAPEPTFFGAIGMQTRTLVRQLSATVNDLVAAFQTGDIVTISKAVNHAVADVAFSAAKFVRSVNTVVVDKATAFFKAIAPAPATLAPVSPAPAPAASAPAAAMPSVPKVVAREAAVSASVNDLTAEDVVKTPAKRAQLATLGTPVAPEVQTDTTKSETKASVSAGSESAASESKTSGSGASVTKASEPAKSETKASETKKSTERKSEKSKPVKKSEPAKSGASEGGSTRAGAGEHQSQP